MYNKCFLIGRLVRDPEMRVTSSGIAVTTFTMAVDRPKRGTEKSADFIRITAWRRLGEICGQYLKKGKLIAIEGRLQFGSYDRDGQSVTTADVVADNMQMLDRGVPEDVTMVPDGMMN